MSIKAAQINCQQETAPLSETGQKSNSMFAKYYNPHSFVLYYFIYLISDRIFQYPDAFKNWSGGVYLKRIHNKITKPMCYHYCFYAVRNAA